MLCFVKDIFQNYFKVKQATNLSKVMYKVLMIYLKEGEK